MFTKSPPYKEGSKISSKGYRKIDFLKHKGQDGPIMKEVNWNLKNLVKNEA